MSREHKVMVGIGAAVIVGMLLVTAFSLGVYVGENGWTWRGVSLAGPGPQPGMPVPGQRPPSGPVGGRALAPGRPDLVGMVRAREGHIVSLATQDGPRIVVLTRETQVLTVQGEVVGGESLEPGTLVAVFGHPGEERRTFAVDVVVLLPPQERAP